MEWNTEGHIVSAASLCAASDDLITNRELRLDKHIPTRTKLHVAALLNASCVFDEASQALNANRPLTQSLRA